jgi:ribonuclease P protein component
MNGPGARFPRAARLTKPSHYAAVFAGRNKLCGRFFCLHWLVNELGQARLGLVVAKRVARRAVARNRFKRLIRETFRCWAGRRFPIDLVVRVAPEAPNAPWQELRRDLDELLLRLEARLSHHFAQPEGVAGSNILMNS